MKLWGPLPCPECGRAVVVRWLVLEDEGGADRVFLLDCMTGDFSVSATEGELLRVVGEVVRARLRHA